MSAVDILQKLVEFPSYEEDGMRKCAKFLSNELSRVGFTVAVDELSNVYGSRQFASGNDAFLINTHFDTVTPSTSWTRNPMQVSVEGDHLYGLGTADSKGGIAASLQALRDLDECRFKKLEVLFSNYEDNSGVLDGKRWLGTPYFLAHNRLEAETGINVEGTTQADRFMVSLGCGGRVAFDVTVIGKEAHTAEPSWRTLGHNAIYDMIKVIETLRKMPAAKMTIDDYDAYTELNVSLIQGGTAINIVPGECKIECERRVLPNEDWDIVKSQVENFLRMVRDVEFKVYFYEPQRSYLLDRADPLVELAVASTQQTLGYTPKFRVDSGRTDSGYFDQLAGIKTFIMGPGEGSAVEHKPNEYVSAKRIEEFSRIMRYMLTKSV
ncbi:MAG: M20/M25/M40 family metallo-hydrolase [Candidatus Bathyarchaeia archaeon]|jgi:acetylornithine deacetylase/succinyl-diaminopimelate desuccinylase-like protein